MVNAFLAGSRHYSNPILPFSAWVNGRQLSRMQAISLTLHLLGLLVILNFSTLHVAQNGPKPPGATGIERIFFPGFPPAARQEKGQEASQGGGSGGARQLGEWTRGRVPPFARLQIAPPAPPRNPNAILIVPPTLVGPPELQVPNVGAGNWGDPQARAFTDSSGPGSGDGMGDKCCGAIGPGRGRGYGPGEDWGAGGGRPKAGTLNTTHPVCVYCPNPGYTDEARKARFQGSVVLRAVITVDGRATNLRVIKGAGLGLDKEAIETVRTWRFKPSLGPNRQPIEVWQDIEINFHIY